MGKSTETAADRRKAAASYTANDFQALEGLDAVRKRPGMYIGSTDSRGLAHLHHEIFDNAVDEAIAGFCTNMWVILRPDGSIEISDDGRGIPVDINEKTGMSGVAMAMTKLHAGGKFGGSGYKTSGGLHGVGAAVVNALSERVDVTIYRNESLYKLSFHNGEPCLFDGEELGAKYKKADDVKRIGPAPKGRHGTTVRFWPNAALFTPGAHVDRSVIIERARKTAFLVPGLTIDVRDLRGSDEHREKFHFEGGIRDMVDFLDSGKPLCDTVHLTGSGTFTESVPVLEGDTMVTKDVERSVEVNVAFRYNTGYDESVHSFVNVVTTPKGGTHVKGFERALLAGLRKGYEGTRLLKASEEPPILEDLMEGLTAVVSVAVPEPQFEGQTKEILGTPGVTKIVQDVVAAGIRNWMEAPRTKNQARLVLEKVANAARARVASRTQREASRRKTALEGASMPAKLVDCRATGVERAEIFIVEGDSALGSARAGRNSEYQALLPIRGKILNVQKASMADMLKNSECAAIIQCIGAGSGRSFDLDAMRYHRIIIMADADVDGSHIRTLLITLVAKYMRPIIEAGRLYAAMPPLFKIDTMGKNAESFHAYSKAEMEQLVAKLEKAGKKIKTPIQRYKGLGEMSSEELWTSTMDPATRSIRRITMSDIEDAERVLELLMGSQVEPRRDWIIENADHVDRDAIDI